LNSHVSTYIKNIVDDEINVNLKIFDPTDPISKFTKTRKFTVGDNKTNLKFQFEYKYDTDNPDKDNSTEVYFNIIKKLSGKEKNNDTILIYQNPPPLLKCRCKKKAITILGYWLLCDDCKNNNESNLNYSPIINSPHIGL
jgi:hypothetical protein